MFDQLAVAAHGGRDHQAAKRHRFQRLKRRHKFREPTTAPRKSHHVSQAVVCIDLSVRYAASEDHCIVEITRGDQ